ncbi:MAG: hypothetical protein B6I20_02420 [Bacteroidetes bacterium 4572_117]|nr:MAG: hypothetical protein B6I20_02420 [Bacteroidetes bacterium 4572_117]
MNQNNTEQRIQKNSFEVSVLYVANDNSISLSVKTFLQKKINHLYIAENGREGLDLFFEHKPDIIITGLEMPVMGGLEMIEKIDKKNGSKVYITGDHFNRQNLLDAIDIGIDGFFVTPIDFRKLQFVIEKVFEEKNLGKNLQKKEAIVKKSEKNYHELFENSLVGIYRTSATGEILSANPALYKMLGYSSLKELSNSIQAVDLYVDKATRERYISNLDRDGYVKGLEGKWFTKNKRQIFIRESAKKSVNENMDVVFEGTVENITHQKKAELKLLHIAMELRNLIDTVNVPVIGIDKSGKINEWNMASDELFLYTKREVIGKNFIELLIPEKYKDEIGRAINDSFSGHCLTNYKCNLSNNKGEQLIMLISTTTRNNYYGNINGIVLVAQDVTRIERHKTILEKKVDDRTKELKKALEKEKELGILKSRFVAMASHEFRTPLTAISFAAGFLKKYNNKLSEEQKGQKLLKIEHQVKHMTRLLEEILHVEKIDTIKIKIKPRKLNFIDFIKPIIDDVCHFTDNTHTISVSSKQKNCEIFIDPDRGKNIFTNLLTNAIKFSPKAIQVNVVCQCTNGVTVVEIIDKGIGIKKNEITLIYDDFFRGENVETIQGTGLGLSIVKRNIKLHNGEILMETNLGKGTKFIVKLPLNNTRQ